MKELLDELLSNDPLFVGLGNVLRHDDGLGVYFCQKLQSLGHRKVLIVELSLENYLSTINQHEAEEVVIVDAVNFDQAPGYFELIAVEQIASQTTHTHNLAVPDLAVWIDKSVKVLGVQPGDVSFGEGLTAQVQVAVDDLSRLVSSILTLTKL